VLDSTRKRSLAGTTRSLRMLIVEDDPNLLAEMMWFVRAEMGFDPW
jgi:hypothetical protein